MKKRVIGGEISVATPPSIAKVKKEWSKMVEDGEIDLRVSCVPHQIISYSTKKGKLEKREVTVYGQMFPLVALRQKLLDQHLPYMRLQTDGDIEKLSEEEIKSLTVTYNLQISPEDSISDLRSTLKRVERSRSLVLWHDHGTILELGCILICIHLAYDPAVFLTCTVRI